MPETLTSFTIGEITAVIESHDTSFIRTISEQYHPFSSSKNSNLKIHITITHEELPTNDTINVSFDETIYTIDGGEFCGTFDTKTNTGCATMKAEKSVLDSFLRVLYSIILTHQGGFLVHSAGLAREKKSYLFAGQSTSGKTTTARHATDFDVLNDELTLVKYKNNQYYLFATPFCGDYDKSITNNNAPLEKLFFLNKKVVGGFKFVEPSDALVKILENVFFFDPSFEANQTILNLCHKLVQDIDAFEINVLSKNNLWELINEVDKQCGIT